MEILVIFLFMGTIFIVLMIRMHISGTLYRIIGTWIIITKGT